MTVQTQNLCHVLQDKRLAWYDLDLSTKPYRALRYHSHALRSVAFHRKYPLFASASDDASVHIFHGMVYQVSRVLVSHYAPLNAAMFSHVASVHCVDLSLHIMLAIC